MTTYLFTYKAKCLHKEDYAKHSGKAVTVLKDSGIKHEGDPLMKVKADDGWEGFAFMSELTPV